MNSSPDFPCPGRNYPAMIVVGVPSWVNLLSSASWSRPGWDGDCRSSVFRCRAQSAVSHAGRRPGPATRRVFPPRLAVLSCRDDGVHMSGRDTVMTRLRIMGPVTADRGYALGFLNLRQQVAQHGCIAYIVAGHAHRAGFQGLCVDTPKMHLAPLSPVLGLMLLGLPFPLSYHIDAGAVDQQVQPGLSRTARVLNGQGFLSAAQRAVVRHRPVEISQRQQAADQTRALVQWQIVQCYDHQAKLDSGIGEGGITSPLVVAHSTQPRHRQVKPHRQRATLLQRRVIVLLVRGAVFRGGKYSHHGATRVSSDHHSRSHAGVCATKPLQGLIVMCKND